MWTAIPQTPGSLVQCVHFTNTMLLLGALTLTWWWLRGLHAAGSVGRRAGDSVGDAGADDSYGRYRIGSGAGRYSLPFTVIARRAGAGLCCERSIAGTHALDASGGRGAGFRGGDCAVPPSFAQRRVVDRRTGRASDRAGRGGHRRARACCAAGTAPAGRRPVLDRVGGSCSEPDLRRQSRTRGCGRPRLSRQPNILEVA